MIDNTINSLPCKPSVKYSTEPLNFCMTVFKLFNLEYMKSTDKIDWGLKENAA